MSAFGDWRPTDAEEIRTWLRNEEVSPENVRVLELDGNVVGYGDVWLDDDVELDMAAPGHWDTFLDWAEERGRASGKPRVRAFFPEGHELEQILAARGYRYWRSAFVMRIDLDERPEAPPLPTGFELRSYRDEDAEALRLGLNEAFGHDPFFHPISPGNFCEFFLKARGTDLSLWRIAWSGEELAGWALSWPCRGSDDTLGWLGNLGVRPACRARGLGGALLRHAFAALYDHGLRRAGLGVDAENPTGALGLYERAGMRRELRQDNWVVDL
jgi:ribosomal protein S18 acetylase RimI-like enzyme